MKRILTVVTLTVLALIGCTHREGYEAMQQAQESECNKLLASEYDKCMASMKESYDSYNEKRKEAIGSAE